MASPFETEGAFLTQEQADHINERHVFRKEHVKTSIFFTLEFSRLVKGCIGADLGKGRRKRDIII